jgi:hypothetical protein
MMSADPTVPDPYNPQAWNRYSYVGNDPLTFTDPTGYSWLSSFFSAIGSFFRSIFSNSIVRAIAQIALAIILTPTGLTGLAAGVGAALAAAASTAIVTGLAGGKLGQILRASLIAGATAFAFFEVGEFTDHTPPFGTLQYAENIVGHAAVGCLSSVASGGKCESGALSGAAGSATAPLVGDIVNKAPDYLTRTIEGSTLSGVVGGLASVAGGGKFADGAVTAAFGYLFNDLAVIYSHQLPGSLNIFGHIALAVTGAGVYSFGNNTDLGSSATDYLQSQVQDRDVTVTIIKTTPEQDQSALDYLNGYTDRNGVGLCDNCANRTATALIRAGILTPLTALTTIDIAPIPSDVSNAAQIAPGASTTNIPQRTPVTVDLNSFNPNRTPRPQ